MALDSGLTVDAAQPLNLTHPLLRDVEGVWIPTESRAGGTRLYDLSPRSHHGNFTDFDRDSGWKVGSQGPGVRIDNAGDSEPYDRIEVPIDTTFGTQSVYIAAQVTLAGVQPNSFEGDTFAVIGGYGTLGSIGGIIVGVKNEQAFSQIRESNGNAEDVVGTTNLNDGALHTIEIFLDRETSTFKVYVDGVLEDTSSSFATGSIDEENTRYLMGVRDGGGGNYGWPLDGTIFWHAVSVGSLPTKPLHTQARRGFPDLLNRRTGADLYVLSGDGSSTGTTYTVSGTVTDSGGTAIQGATVSLENVTGAAQTTDTTDASGNYWISVTLEDSDLPDTWDVVASASGYTEQLKQVSASTSSTSYTTDFSLSPKYSLAPNSLSQTHTLGAPSVAAAFTLAPNDSAHGHTLGAGGLNVAYVLTPNGLVHSHTLDGTAIGTGVVLTPNDVQHGHTLDASSVAVAFTLSPDDAGHTHTLDAGGVNVAYTLTPSGLQQGHTLASTGLDTGLVLSPNDVSHSQTFDPSGVSVAFTLSPNDATQGHSIAGGSVAVAYALTPNGVQHAHSIGEAGASVAYTLSPNGLLHPQSVGVSGVSVAYALSPNDTQHEHLLGPLVLIVKGNAECASLEATPIYQIGLSAKPSPELNVTLSATPIIKKN